MRIAFTGDILSYMSQDKMAYNNTNGYDSYFEKATGILKNCDYVVGSFETTCSGHILGYTRDNESFNSPESILYSLKKCGFNLLTTANNHCLDRGITGLDNTIDAIERAGLEHTGTFKNRSEKRYLIKTIAGVRIAFVSFTYGTNSENNGCILSNENRWRVNLFRRQISIKRKRHTLLLKRFVSFFVRQKVYGGIQPDCAPADDAQNELNFVYLNDFRKSIEDAKQEADLVICLLHVGGQFNSQPGQFTKDIVQMAADSGADAIICNHSHTVQQISVNSDGKVFAWALGNFSFTPNEGYYVPNVLADYSAVVYLDIDSEQKSIKDISFSICKSVYSSNGVRVVPIYDLYNDLSEEQKSFLEKDAQALIDRIVGLNVKQQFVLLPEYRLKDFLEQ